MNRSKTLSLEEILESIKEKIRIINGPEKGKEKGK
jgi:hypothetical protein